MLTTLSGCSMARLGAALAVQVCSPDGLKVPEGSGPDIWPIEESEGAVRKNIRRRAITPDGLHAHITTTDAIGVLPVRPVITTITLAVNPISSVCGRSMTFTAAVAAVPPGSETPTGTVTFSVDDSPATPVTLTGGVATFTTPLNAGSHTIIASYTGDTYHHPAPLTTLTTRIWRTGLGAALLRGD